MPHMVIINQIILTYVVIAKLNLIIEWKSG